MLFLLFVNGIKNAVSNCKFLMFADDSKLLRKAEFESDYVLQNELDALNLCRFRYDLMLINISPCPFPGVVQLLFTWTLLSVQRFIESHDSKKDLGVLFSSDLNFHLHIEVVCCRAFKTLGFVMRTSKEFKLSRSLRIIYCSHVRSLLEYMRLCFGTLLR